MSGQQPPSEHFLSLCVENLESGMDENFMRSCFFEHIKRGKLVYLRSINNQTTGDYGLLEFKTHAIADYVLRSYNGRVISRTSYQYQLNWATDESSIFVGSLGNTVTCYILRDNFLKDYTSVKGANVVIDKVTGQTKHYGFVRFGDQEEQKHAMSHMNHTSCANGRMVIQPAKSKKGKKERSI
ncbi:OLC1v1030452C1 [Oldenlandia corymbosa var. corymbosa]|uniref:OLC1v1030452C1 n=1 Tax=Oldenlandia corymbosa var. corymbosa TaxID=529605 RepID=A0AAV1CJ42_OLDCO|nr:OLC1v1030452C1 [Oldenlandia corymbosa var. corymbosa]